MYKVEMDICQWERGERKGWCSLQVDCIWMNKYGGKIGHTLSNLYSLVCRKKKSLGFFQKQTLRQGFESQWVIWEIGENTGKEVRKWYREVNEACQ